MQNVVGMLLLMSTQNPVHIFVDVFRSLNLKDNELESHRVMKRVDEPLQPSQALLVQQSALPRGYP